MTRFISEAQWSTFFDQGYLKLGKLLDGAEVKAMQDRLDAIMLGKADIDYAAIRMQLEGSNQYAPGFQGATLNYRILIDLEYDPLFLRYLQRPMFKDCCDRLYGQHVPISVYRAFVMNKAARGGSSLGWHQDRWAFFDRDPLLTVWTAIDPANKASGCVKIIPGSHRYGVINPAEESGFLTIDQVKETCTPDKIEYLELEPGEVAILHNWLLHASDSNKSERPRRGFSVCYCDARTRNNAPDAGAGRYGWWTRVFGEGAISAEQLEAGTCAVPHHDNAKPLASAY